MTLESIEIGISIPDAYSPITSQPGAFVPGETSPASHPTDIKIIFLDIE